jgi:Tol biopolymer transport system component
MGTRRVITVLFAVAAIAALAVPAALAGRIEVASVNSAGELGNGFSGAGNASADGRFVVINSAASNLVPGDTNGVTDVFVRDRVAGTTQRVSVSSSGAEGDGPSYPGQISGNGRYVLFGSYATNLVPGDTNGAPDVFVRDLEAGTTERVNVTSAGVQADAGSSGYLTLGTQISFDGRYAVFTSGAANLLAPLAADGRGNVFVRDRVSGTTECVSVDGRGKPMGGELGAMSADGRFIVFINTPLTAQVTAETLPAVYLRDRVAGTTTLVSVDSAGNKLDLWCQWPSISGDGSTVAFQAMKFDFVGWQPESPDRVYVRDLRAGTTEVLDLGSWEASLGGELGLAVPSISSDGRFIGCQVLILGSPTSGSFNTRIFVVDRREGTVVQIAPPSGDLPNASMGYAYVSSDGRYVVFDTEASNFVPGDTNGTSDVFVYDQQTFEDVPVASWAFAQIEACVRADVVKRNDGLYRPRLEVTRDAMAAYIARALAGGDTNVPAASGAAFPDVKPDNWAYDYVCYAKNNGVVSGYGDGLYHPEWVVDRGQMAVFIARALAGGDDRVPFSLTKPAFSDVTWFENQGYLKYVQYLAKEGVVNGYSDGCYHPDYKVTRDQMAVFIARAFELK